MGKIHKTLFPLEANKLTVDKVILLKINESLD